MPSEASNDDPLACRRVAEELIVGVYTKRQKNSMATLSDNKNRLAFRSQNVATKVTTNVTTNVTTKVTTFADF